MKILMVCLGNICRSPLAEGILKSKLPPNFIVDSAGTIDMHEGKKPDPRSIQIANQNQIDISMQSSRPFKIDDFQKFDRIYCMDRNNYQDVVNLATSTEDREKVFLILENNQDVPDPYYGGLKGFEEVYQLLDKACEKLSLELLSK